MRSIFVLLILVMIGLNGKGQSVTALPDSVLSQCCLEVTLLNGNVTTVDWVFVQYITRDGTGTKLFVEYAPNFGGIQWETQIRIQDDFDDVLERSKFIVIPFTVGSTDYGINRNWIANIEENTTTGGTWIYGRFGTPTKRKFSAVEDYETMKNLLLACRPRAIVVAENGLYTEGDTVRMGGFLIEPTTITTEGYNWIMKDTLSTQAFGIDYNSIFGDTVFYASRRWGKWRNTMQQGRNYFTHEIEDTATANGKKLRFINGIDGLGDLYSYIQYTSGTGSTQKTNWFSLSENSGFWTINDKSTNPYYTQGITINQNSIGLSSFESGGPGMAGTGVSITANGSGSEDEWIGIVTKGVDNGTASNGQYLQLVDNTNGKVEFATIDLSAYLPIADTAAMLDPYIQGAGTINRVPIFTGSRVIGNSNIQDNGTAVSILSSKPFQLGQWTTAGRPSGTNGYAGFNTSFNWPEWYSSSGWFSPARAATTGGAFTATYIPFGGSGGLTESANLLYDGTNLSIKPTTNNGILITSQSNPFDRAIFRSNEYTMSRLSDGALGVVSVRRVPGRTDGSGAINARDNLLFTVDTRTYMQLTSFGLAMEVSPSFDALISNNNASTLFDIRTTTKGVSPFPRQTNAQRSAIASPITGLASYQTDGTEGIYVKAAGAWKKLLWDGDAATTWLKTELEASRDVDITGGTSTDFRLRSNTRTQFDGKFKVGSDSSFVHDPAQDTTYLKGNARIQSGNLTVEKASGTPYLNIVGKSTGNQEAGIYMESRGNFGSIFEINGQSVSQLVFYNYQRAASAGNNFTIGENNGRTGATAYGDFIVVDSISNSSTANRRFRFDSRGEAQFYNYGTPATTAAALSKTLTNYGVGFATDGTVTSREIKRDTTIYVVDADYDFSAALTTAQVAARHNRVIFLMTTTAAAGSNSELTLHTPDVNLMQCEYLVRSTDEAGGFDNRIIFGTNNAVDSTNALVTNYYPSAGSGVGIRAGLRSGVYKYFYY